MDQFEQDVPALFTKMKEIVKQRLMSSKEQRKGSGKSNKSTEDRQTLTLVSSKCNHCIVEGTATMATQQSTDLGRGIKNANLSRHIELFQKR